VATVDYALLCHAALVQENGLLSVLGGGVDRVGGVEFPLRFALTLAFRIEWDDAELELPHSLLIRVEHPDGERLAEVQGGLVAQRMPGVGPGMPVGSIAAVPLALDVRRPGLYRVRISVDGDELKALPLSVSRVGDDEETRAGNARRTTRHHLPMRVRDGRPYPEGCSVSRQPGRRCLGYVGGAAVRWAFDSSSDSLYVYLQQGQPTKQTELPDGVVVDWASDDTPIGFEVLTASRGWSPLLVATELSLPPDDAKALAMLHLATLTPTALSSPAGRLRAGVARSTVQKLDLATTAA
jgi:uncharacterized protein YuzE